MVEDIKPPEIDWATPQGEGQPPQQNKERRQFKNFRFYPSSKKQWAIGGGISVAVLIIGIIGGIRLYKNITHRIIEKQAAIAKAQKPPKTTAPSRLTGVEIPIEVNNRPLVAFQIENSPDARPQAGLKDAGVIYEAIAEGGITRFNAIFLEGQPDYIGPVRSVRPYYIDWFLPFDAALVHAGGSAQGLADVRSLGVKDIDHGANGPAFRRVSNRVAPHNLYTSMAEIDKIQQAKGFKSTFTGFMRKADKAATPPTATKIDLNLSAGLYNAHYDYDAPTNSYKRSEGGKPHVDDKSGAQLQPKVVIALVIPFSKSGIYSVYQTTGSGKMFVFQDGVRTEGTWSKADRKSQYKFTDTGGAPLKLNAGQTWLTAVGDAGMVVSAP